MSLSTEGQGNKLSIRVLSVVPQDVERLFEIRLLFILKSTEKTRESCINSCSQWYSQVAPKIGTAGEKSGSAVPQDQGQAGGSRRLWLQPSATPNLHIGLQLSLMAWCRSPQLLSWQCRWLSYSIPHRLFWEHWYWVYEKLFMAVFPVISSGSLLQVPWANPQRERSDFCQFHISVSICAGGFSTGAGFVWVSVLEQPFHCFGFQGQCLNHLNSCLLLTYWPCSLLIAHFHPY